MWQNKFNIYYYVLAIRQKIKILIGYNVLSRIQERVEQRKKKKK